MKKIYFIIIISIFVTSIYAQKYSSSNKKAIKFYEKARKAYSSEKNEKVIKFCKKATEADPNFVEPNLLISRVYFAKNDFDNSLKYLKTAHKIAPERTDVLFSIIELYFKEKNYETALIYINKYLNLSDLEEWQISSAEKAKATCEFRIWSYKNPIPYNPERLPKQINTENREYFPSLTPDENTLIFTRQIGTNEDIYISYKTKNGWTAAKSVSKNINSPANEGASTISADGKTVIFGRCTREDGCDIFVSGMTNAENWSQPKRISNSINTRSWESQPCISADGKTIYFTSNRMGGKGKMDIWKIERLESGTWLKAINLGDSINTEGNETSPFIHADNQTLYFASDFWTGMGGYDVFVSRKNIENEWSEPQNLGYPINTHDDEWRIILNTKGNIAYFSSDRDSTQMQDIYTFEVPKSAQPQRTIYVKAKIFDNKTRKPLNSNYEIISLKDNKLQTKNLQKSEFIACLPTQANYMLNVSKNGYLFHSENFSLENLPDSINFYHINIYMKPIVSGETIILKNVFFDTDSYILKPESYPELDKLVVFLTNNKTLKVEIGGHTDNVGTEVHNKKLSENRAKTVTEYLTKKGIDINRLTYKGYGFSQPISTNDTPEGRAKNRRTEFKIVQ